MKTLVFFCSMLYYSAFAQEQNGSVMSSKLKRYDESLIAPALRGKYSVSLGGVFRTGLGAEETNGVGLKGGLHAGFNFMLLKDRKLKLAFKDRKRSEMRILGAHLTMLSEEHYFMLTYFGRGISRKGRFLSFYILSEYGLGYHYRKEPIFDNKPFEFHGSLEVLRIRFGALPCYIHGTVNYDFGNDLLAKTRWDVHAFLGLRYYFYKGR